MRPYLSNEVPMNTEAVKIKTFPETTLFLFDKIRYQGNLTNFVQVKTPFVIYR